MPVIKQERTGRLKWLKELRETEWHPYIRELFKKNVDPNEVKDRLEIYRKWAVLVHDELEMLCKYAKKQFNLKHASEGLRLIWIRRHCSDPNCRTCYSKWLWHYPYPSISSDKPFDFEYLRTSERTKDEYVRRKALRRFLMSECSFTSTQVDLFFDLIDLRHLMIRRFNYEVEEYRNLGLLP